MKIRIKGNTIRIRLTRSEVAYFNEHGKLMEETHFTNSVFSYGLLSSDTPSIKATFQSNGIIIEIPHQQANDWTTTSLVGLSGEMPLPHDKTLFLLVEKDFKCLDETSEDQSDQYPNPLAEQH
jgi:hypothetical protein